MEKHILKIMAELWKAEDPLTVFDIGAAPGTLTELIIKSFPRATCFAVEACPKNTAAMRKNLAHLPNAHVLNRMIAADCECHQFYFADQPKFTDGSSISNSLFRKHISTARWAKHVKAVEMPGVTIDVLREECGVQRIDALILNCEGCEYEVFSGPLDFLSRTTMFALQIHNRGRVFKAAKFASLRKKIPGMLSDRGFELAWEQKAGPHRDMIWRAK